jgi:hypothetical protein
MRILLPAAFVCTPQNIGADFLGTSAALFPKTEGAYRIDERITERPQTDCRNSFEKFAMNFSVFLSTLVGDSGTLIAKRSAGQVGTIYPAKA